MRHLRHTSGEEVYTRATEGYDKEHGWSVVKANNARAPSSRLSADEKRRAKFRTMDQADIVDMLLGEIDALKERLKRLEQ